MPLPVAAGNCGHHRINRCPGAPLVVASTKGGKNLVSLHFYPPSCTTRADFWVGDSVNLLKSALLF